MSAEFERRRRRWLREAHEALERDRRQLKLELRQPVRIYQHQLELELVNEAQS